MWRYAVPAVGVCALMIGPLAVPASAVTPQSRISTIGGGGTASPGDGGPARSASMYPQGIAVDSDGYVYYADPDARMVRKISPAGRLTPVAGDGSQASPTSAAGDGGRALSAQLDCPRNVAVDDQDNVYIADPCHRRLRKVTPGGVITTVAGGGSNFPTMNYPAENEPATSVSLSGPNTVVTDHAGNVYISVDIPSGSSDVLYRIAPDGTMTWAGGGGLYIDQSGNFRTWGEIGEVKGLAIDGAGMLYAADYWGDIYKVNPTTHGITTVAGGGYDTSDGIAATRARLEYLNGVGVDASGNVFFAEEYRHRVRQVSPNGIVTTLAGNGGTVTAGDGGPAISASVPYPYGIAVDGRGWVYVSTDGRIRLVADGAPTAFLLGDHGPRVDTYNYDGMSVKACTREVNDYSIVTYYCRDFDQGPFVVDHWTWQATTFTRPGDVSGGDSHVIMKDGHVYEGCMPEGSVDVCQTRAKNQSVLQYRQQAGQYYRVALGTWTVNQATAVACVGAIYSTDAYDIVHNCFTN